MNLILLAEEDRIDNDLFRLEDNRAVHVKDILDARSGDSVQVGLINGPTGYAEINELNSSSVILQVKQWQPEYTFPYNIDLICALPRPQTVKKLLFLSGMTGIRSLYLIRANRVEKSYFDSPLLTEDKMRTFLYEGMSQGKNTRLPNVSIHNRFKPFIEDTLDRFYETELPQKILPEPDAKNTLPAIIDKDESSYIIAIGPEGGWVPFELDVMEQSGFILFNLSNWTLRVEHAAMAAITQVEMIKKKG